MGARQDSLENVHEGAGLAAGALGDATLVEGDGLAHGAPTLVLDEGVGGLKGCSGEGGQAGDEGAGGTNEGEEGGGLIGSCQPRVPTFLYSSLGKGSFLPSWSRFAWGGGRAGN